MLNKFFFLKKNLISMLQHFRKLEKELLGRRTAGQIYIYCWQSRLPTSLKTTLWTKYRKHALCNYLHHEKLLIPCHSAGGSLWLSCGKHVWQKANTLSASLYMPSSSCKRFVNSFTPMLIFLISLPLQKLAAPLVVLDSVKVSCWSCCARAGNSN